MRKEPTFGVRVMHAATRGIMIAIATILGLAGMVGFILALAYTITSALCGWFAVVIFVFIFVLAVFIEFVVG